jgi:hypothetical protein
MKEETSSAGHLHEDKAIQDYKRAHLFVEARHDKTALDMMGSKQRGKTTVDIFLWRSVRVSYSGTARCL